MAIRLHSILSFQVIFLISAYEQLRRCLWRRVRKNAISALGAFSQRSVANSRARRCLLFTKVVQLGIWRQLSRLVL